MSELVVRLAPGCYVLWSRTVDAPTSGLLDRAAIVRHIVDHRDLHIDEAESLLEVVDANGTSDPTFSVSDIVGSNRAGTDGSALTLEQIIEQYR
jgi:hypothetical protein